MQSEHYGNAYDPSRIARRHRPQNLLKFMIALMGLSGFFILLLACYGIHRIYSIHIVRHAETDAINIASAIFSMEKNELLPRMPGVRPTLTISKDGTAALDQRMRNYLRPFDIVKIKIYDADRRIIFSTDSSVIGRLDRNNHRLERAFTGRNDSKLEKKEEVLDLADERKIDVDVVETYVPIFGNGKRVIGVFEVYIDVSRWIADLWHVVLSSGVLLTVVMLMASAVSLWFMRKAATQIREAHDALEIMAITDSLTTLLNRRHILAQANRELALVQRDTGSYGEKGAALIMIDVDRFKCINDNYGHLAGDEVLKELSGRIRRSLRDYDLIGRYGGEEFLAVMPAVGFAGAVSAIRRVRELITCQPFIVGAEELNVTVSFGFTMVEKGDASINSALKRADTALYAAKAGGRDAVFFCDEEGARRIYLSDEPNMAELAA